MSNVKFYLEKSSDGKAIRSICKVKGEKFKNLCNS